LSIYDQGATTFYACQADQRFSYCLYAPQQIRPGSSLLVVIHGSRRTPEKYRDLLAGFAEQQGLVVLCPLFPVGIPVPEETGGYKFLRQMGVEYDRILLSMVEEVGDRFAIETERFFMHGFSGGGQFAQRFLYLYPERLAGLSVGAPGLVTLPDEQRGWWAGIGDIEAQFGIKVDFDTIASVPVQLIVGADDRETGEITLNQRNRYWMPGANDAGADRVARCQTLARALRDRGVPVQLDVVPGISHKGFELLPQITRFFERILSDGIR